MKRRLVLALLGNLFALHTYAADLPTLKVLTMPTLPPFEWKDEKTGQMTGFDMDLIRAIANHAGFIPSFNPIDFDGIVPSLQTGSADMGIASIYITPKRQKVVDFSIPYYESGASILVRADNTTIHSLKDLAGKKVATLTGSGSYEFINENAPQATNIAYPQTPDLYVALMGHSVDAVFHDAPNIAYYIKTKGTGTLKKVGPNYMKVELGIAFPKGSKWLSKVNDALKEMKTDVSYQKLVQKYFSE